MSFGTIMDIIMCTIIAIWVIYIIIIGMRWFYNTEHENEDELELRIVEGIDRLTGSIWEDSLYLIQFQTEKEKREFKWEKYHFDKAKPFPKEATLIDFNEELELNITSTETYSVRCVVMMEFYGIGVVIWSDDTKLGEYTRKWLQDNREQLLNEFKGKFEKRR